MVSKKTKARIANQITRLYNLGEELETKGRYFKREALILRKETNKLLREIEKERNKAAPGEFL